MYRIQRAFGQWPVLLAIFVLVTGMSACHDVHGNTNITSRNTTLVVSCQSACEVRFELTGHLTIRTSDFLNNNCSMQSAYGQITILCPSVPMLPHVVSHDG